MLDAEEKSVKSTQYYIGVIYYKFKLATLDFIKKIDFEK